MRPALLCIVVMFLALAGASGSPLLQRMVTNPVPSSTMRQDTIVVRAPAQGRWGTDVRLVEDLRIGVLEGEPEYMFGRVGDLAVGRDGSIYVVDRSVPEIRQYDAEGQFVRRIGAEGQGPGEYGLIEGIEVLPDGRLAIWDPRHRRLTVYSADGRYQDSWLVPSGLHGSRTFGIDHAGHYYVMKTFFDEDQPPQEDKVWPKGFLKVASGGAVLDTIPLPSNPGDGFVLYGSEGPMYNFAQRFRYAWSPLGYLVAGHNRTYSFDLLRPDEPVLRIVRDAEPVRLKAEERDQWRAWGAYFSKRSGKTYSLPSTKPAFRDIYVGDEGRIWVDRYAEAVRREPRPRDDDRPERLPLTWRQPRTFDVFEPDGVFLGTVIGPPETWLVRWRGEYVWGVERGPSDEPYVVRFRIVTAE